MLQRQGEGGSREACEQNGRVVVTMSDALKRRAMVGAHVTETIFPRIYSRTNYAHPRARVMSFSDASRWHVGGPLL